MCKLKLVSDILGHPVNPTHLTLWYVDIFGNEIYLIYNVTKTEN